VCIFLIEFVLKITLH